jgi:hypothetical protein
MTFREVVITLVVSLIIAALFKKSLDWRLWEKVKPAKPGEAVVKAFSSIPKMLGTFISSIVLLTGLAITVKLALFIWGLLYGTTTLASFLPAPVAPVVVPTRGEWQTRIFSKGIWSRLPNPLQVQTNYGFAMVLPPQSRTAYQFNYTDLHSGSFSQLYLVDGTVTTGPLSATELQRLTGGDSMTSASYVKSIPYLPYSVTIPNADIKEITVVYVEGIASQRPPSLQLTCGETTDTRGKEMYVHQWIVSIDGPNTAIFTIPESGWSSMWIVAINDGAYLSRRMDEIVVPPEGLKVESLALKTKQYLRSHGATESEATQTTLELQKEVRRAPIKLSQINYQGLYWKKGREVHPLNRPVTFRADDSDDLRGQTITLGLNVLEADKRNITPAKVLVGIAH